VQPKAVRYTRFGVNLGPSRPIEPKGKHQRKEYSQSPAVHYWKEDKQFTTLNLQPKLDEKFRTTPEPQPAYRSLRPHVATVIPQPTQNFDTSKIDMQQTARVRTTQRMYFTKEDAASILKKWPTDVKGRKLSDLNTSAMFGEQKHPCHAVNDINRPATVQTTSRNLP
jgi:hypothetical protein